MKQHLVLGVVGAIALVPVTATTAQASAPAPKAAAMKTTMGKTVSYKGGKLRVAVGKRNVDYVVNKVTQCGSSRGNHGTTIRCSNLSQKRYLSKSVRVLWSTDSRKRRVASIVAVILAKR